MGPGITSYLRLPHTYCWSPSLVSKPKDWGPEIGKPAPNVGFVSAAGKS